MTKKGVIFDLDGTLWDNTGPTAKLWTSIFSRFPETGGLTVNRDDITCLMGKTLDTISDILFPALPEEKRREIMYTCGREETVHIRQNGGSTFEGMDEMLRSLSENYCLYLVSNCQDGYAQAFMDSHGIGHYFADFEMAGRTHLTKGENIRLIIERNSLNAAVYVGDTDGDEKAAKFAGIPFIHAAYGFGHAESPDAVAGNISDLPEIVKKLI